MTNEILNGLEGFYHGLAFSFPLSVPILVCLSRFLLEGLLAGFFASLGTVLGQLCFFFLILNGNSRTFIHFWYTVEPLLAFIGFMISFKLATDFMSGSRIRSGGTRAGLSESQTPFGAQLSSPRFFLGISSGSVVTSFAVSFLLMFLNPAMNSTSSRILLSAGSFFEHSGNSVLTSFPYFLIFVLTFFVCVLFLWPLMITLAVSKGSLPDRLSRFTSLSENVFTSTRGTTLTGGRPKVLTEGETPYPLQLVPEARTVLSFLLVGCLMSGGFQYSWRLFTQYPASFIDKEGGGTGPSVNWVREFPSFDSNIQHRDKNLPLDRHVPVDKMNSRRVLSGRPPLSEQQKADASLKFQSFFLNALEEKIENTVLQYRGAVADLRSPSKSSKVGTRPDSSAPSSTAPLEDFLVSLKSQGRSFNFFQPTLQELSVRFSPRPLENNTKGKPKYSYIRSQNLNPGEEIGMRDILHDQLQVYSALFAK